MNSAMIIACARSFLGVRFRHQGRTRQGLDCLGLLIAIAEECNLPWPEPARCAMQHQHYSHVPSEDELRSGLEAVLQPIAAQAMQPADIVLLRVQGRAQHVGLLADYHAGGFSLIHAYAPARGVIEQRLDEAWKKEIVSAYRLPHVAGT